MIQPHENNFISYITSDPKGKKFPAYIHQLQIAFTTENERLQDNLKILNQSHENIRQIIALQQDYAGAISIKEKISVKEVVENSTILFGSSFSRHGINLTVDIEKIYLW